MQHNVSQTGILEKMDDADLRQTSPEAAVLRQRAAVAVPSASWSAGEVRRKMKAVTPEPSAVNFSRLDAVFDSGDLADDTGKAGLT